ncbi:MAG: tRNA lysidine(34) synthetase TilS [Proteobacteria bacterium]|nr:tRNA lysidine(34) synthetase TilS [Pseudomonadota bacterium]
MASIKKANILSDSTLKSCLESIPDNIERVVLAFSGGLDSCVLLHLLTSHPHSYSVQLWHVNHGLQESADEMEVFCNARAREYGLEIKTSHLHLDPHAGNLESTARQARYALFEKELNQGDCLMTAHHADDQVETFMLNALRGSGSAGLRGIAKSRPIGQSTLFRPLLDISREELSTYARHHQIKWFEDPSNASDRFDRNFLRQQVIPLIKSRWPGYIGSIRSVIEIQAETVAVLEDLAAQDYATALDPSDRENTDTLCRQALLELIPARQKNLIRYWLKQRGCASLPQARINELVSQLRTKKNTGLMIRGNGYSIRLYNQRLFSVLDGDSQPLQEAYEFDRSPVLKIGEIGLEIQRREMIRYLGRNDTGQAIKLMFRLRNNVSNPARHRLKRLFQKHKIPPWKRSITPQIYFDDELVGLWTLTTK